MVESLSQLPVSWANNLTLVMFVAIAIACFAIPFRSIVADAPDHSRWRDVRWWAVALIVFQLCIYVVFQ